MGLIALPVAKAGLSTLLGQDEGGGDAGDAGDEGDEGDTGATVDFSAKLKQLQQFLGVPQTGAPDDATHQALKDYQWAHNLPQTGNLDLATIAALQESAAELAGWSLWTWSLAWAQFHKWWLIGGGAVLALGGFALYRHRRGRGKSGQKRSKK